MRCELRIGEAERSHLKQAAVTTWRLVGLGDGGAPNRRIAKLHGKFLKKEDEESEADLFTSPNIQIDVPRNGLKSGRILVALDALWDHVSKAGRRVATLRVIFDEGIDISRALSYKDLEAYNMALGFRDVGAFNRTLKHDALA